jgi:hypothetical protein
MYGKDTSVFSEALRETESHAQNMMYTPVSASPHVVRTTYFPTLHRLASGALGGHLLGGKTAGA